ncbi:bifunctional 4-hydroxy-2-oxoglutarate aldolase/2-dehydro-3-deoxy-phosphogluconate aldolase [Lachnospiraceae bacterium MD1]|uniref:2-dehydro-3-deoxy-phosphogluconate aldolase n=1 Tax=Variimorphobacter saccharofermentans TaxID=2755051 RepID=A0A839K4P6_9FIRM|nr:bifunctional 4-hydroxy-2-oxoglutarate aldolase/2-dehydro-3-deoxy-phosphogluconate aldolase [Variimorphobacter saccharofermentans]MBB2184596.1 bifunctional 4-hydroxy-2-oxoglutarate aldolase/2-dehydro-3-deoxy-phosphogluconate aldolase [Variimorphobacter saccharofermentans]
MNEMLTKIQKMGIVPVVKLDNAKDAVPLAKALCEGGLPCAEVTFRTAAAEESIRLMRQAYPDMLIGAGTVLTTEQVDQAVNAGATFIVSPGLNPKVVRYCVERNIPITPGCVNPSDIEAAIELGLEVVKFFPAEAAGGLAMIKAMSAPYVNMKFMPTGGINAKNLLSYLDFPKIIACGGSWMVSDELVKAGDFDKITALTREAVNLMLGFELRHIGINASNEAEADHIATSFERLFGFMKNIGNSSIFAGSGIEVMKAPYLGQKGHIAIQTNYIERAIFHLEAQGFTFNQESKKYGKNDKLTAIYLKDEIGGFAVHLVQK